MTTNGYKFYTLNLIAFLKEVAKVPWRLCVICCDSESYSYFRREGIPCVAYQSEHKGQRAIAAFGTDDFARWNRKKVELLHWFAKESAGLGITKTLYLDGDIVVQRDPWAFLEAEWAQGAPDYLFQCDCVGKEDHEGCGVICSGVIAQRITGSMDTLYEFVPEEWLAAERQDQPYIGRRLKTLGIPYKTLKRSLWGNGHWQKGEGWRGIPWVLLHYNYRVGDTKKAAMKTFGHWRIPY
jgi:hypothetical protein